MLPDSDDSSDNEPLRPTQDLHEGLSFASDLAHVDACAFLGPFLDVVMAEHTDASATVTALQSVHKFLVYQHLNMVRLYPTGTCGSSDRSHRTRPTLARQFRRSPTA